MGIDVYELVCIFGLTLYFVNPCCNN